MYDSAEYEERMLEKALAALDVWIAGGDYARPTELGTVVDALYRLHERERTRVDDDDVFFAAVEAAPHGKTLSGIIWARGVTLHAAKAESTIEGSRPFTIGRSTLGGGDTLRGGGVRVVWKARDDLPLRERDRYDRDVKYDSSVAGRPLVETIFEARDVLASIP